MEQPGSTVQTAWLQSLHPSLGTPDSEAAEALSLVPGIPLLPRIIAPPLLSLPTEVLVTLWSPFQMRVSLQRNGMIPLKIKEDSGSKR